MRERIVSGAVVYTFPEMPCQRTDSTGGRPFVAYQVDFTTNGRWIRHEKLVDPAANGTDRTEGRSG